MRLLVDDWSSTVAANERKEDVHHMRLKQVALAFGLATGVLASAQVQAQQKKPNILVIWGDDIGQFNVSAFNRGMMGYKTPSIDQLATQGAVFTEAVTKPQGSH